MKVNLQFTEVWSQISEILITMIHNLPVTAEQPHDTIWSCINTLNIVTHLCMVPNIVPLMPRGSWTQELHASLNLWSEYYHQRQEESNCAMWAYNGRWFVWLPKKCNVFIKCSLSHSQNLVHWSWRLKTVSWQLNKQTWILHQCHISGESWFHCFECVHTINEINLIMEV